MKTLFLTLLIIFCGLSTGLMAQSGEGLLTQGGSSLIEPDRRFSDRSLGERYQRLTRELRCPQCENQAIGDSNAPVSAAMRDRVATLLEKGQSNEEITAYMVERWGQQVTFRPGLGVHTGWIPVVLLIAVVALVAIIVGLRRQHAGQQTTQPLTDDESRRLAALRAGRKNGEQGRS